MRASDPQILCETNFRRDRPEPAIWWTLFAANSERQHATESARHLSCSNVVIGMVFQPWIKHRFKGRMTNEVPRNRKC